MTPLTATHQPVSPAQAEVIVAHHAQALWRHPQLATTLPPLMLWGPPGVGKSAVIRQVASKLKADLIDIRLAQREPVDMRGLPVPDGDGIRWLVAKEWPREEGSRGFLFFDELTAADRALQAAAYELILDRRLGTEYRIPDGWLIVAAGNRSEDHAVSWTMSSALANRFCHIEVGVTTADWLVWATARSLHPDVIAFIRHRPQALFDLQGTGERGWPSPRSWERVAVELQLFDHASPPLPADLQHVVIAGLVGEGMAHELRAFREIQNGLPDALAMLRGDIAICVPERADLRHAFSSGLVHALRSLDHAAAPWSRFLAIGIALPSDFAALAMTEALAGAPAEAVARLLSDPGVAAWSVRHGETFLAPLLADLPQPLRRVLDDAARA